MSQTSPAAQRNWRKRNPGKAYDYTKRWRERHRAQLNFYQKMYAIFGKKENWPA